MQISFGKPDVIADGSNTNIDTTEVDITTLSPSGDFRFSQLSLFVTMDLGTHTAVDLRIYYRESVGSTWHQVPKQNVNTGVVSDFFYRFDSNTPSPIVLDLPLSAAFELKITGQGIGGLNASATVKILARTN